MKNLLIDSTVPLL